MKDLEKITDYTIFSDLLISAYQNKPNTIGLVKADLANGTDIENAIFEIWTLYYLSTATGVQLDNIGAIVGIARDGRTDTEYREVIQARAILNTMSGTPEAMIQACQLLLSATQVHVQNYPGAVLIIYVNVPVTQTQFTSLSSFLPAGVGLIVNDSNNIPISDPFVFFADNTGHGFGKLIGDLPDPNAEGGELVGEWFLV
jgi:hypothetical protein